MRPEGTNGTSGGELLVPMAWMYAEYIADELLRTGDLMPPTTLEFRAGRNALALTIFLSDGAVGGARVVARLDEWSSLTAAGRPWHGWVRERLREREAAGSGPDLALARDAWRWLEETELLAADLDAVVPGGVDPRAEAEDEPRVWTPAWELGLPLGHLAIHLF
ncbi:MULTISPECIES: hypothetical protein [Streptomyces]|uniref:DinB family protein n=1 Tax=Streptomyces noboritoensis TaxID=67337 RepID=A0ABV6TGR6_9ACTN|nr:hypothetical protein [Streptomyces sp. TLI_146]PKV89072.1 hypothetical protein BX283_6705 [Streptomyces sp. TLI_146]